MKLKMKALFYFYNHIYMYNIGDDSDIAHSLLVSWHFTERLKTEIVCLKHISSPETWNCPLRTMNHFCSCSYIFVYLSSENFLYFFQCDLRSKSSLYPVQCYLLLYDIVSFFKMFCFINTQFIIEIANNFFILCFVCLFRDNKNKEFLDLLWFFLTEWHIWTWNNVNFIFR